MKIKRCGTDDHWWIKSQAVQFSPCPDASGNAVSICRRSLGPSSQIFSSQTLLKETHQIWYCAVVLWGTTGKEAWSCHLLKKQAWTVICCLLPGWFGKHCTVLDMPKLSEVPLLIHLDLMQSHFCRRSTHVWGPIIRNNFSKLNINQTLKPKGRGASPHLDIYIL